jgi:hypothetical protein
MNKNLNINIKGLAEKVLPILSKVRRYFVIIFIVIFALICGFLVFRINSLSRQEPSDDAVTEKLSATKSFLQRPLNCKARCFYLFF